jgi:hypothetical protein
LTSTAAASSGLDEAEPDQAVCNVSDDLVTKSHAARSASVLDLTQGCTSGCTSAPSKTVQSAFAEKPLRVEYELMEAAYALLPAFGELLSWSQTYSPEATA